MKTFVNMKTSTITLLALVIALMSTLLPSASAATIRASPAAPAPNPESYYVTCRRQLAEVIPSMYVTCRRQLYVTCRKLACTMVDCEQRELQSNPELEAHPDAVTVKVQRGLGGEPASYYVKKRELEADPAPSAWVFCRRKLAEAPRSLYVTCRRTLYVTCRKLFFWK